MRNCFKKKEKLLAGWAAKMDISFQKLTEENIAVLGYPKSDYRDPQLLG